MNQGGEELTPQMWNSMKRDPEVGGLLQGPILTQFRERETGFY